MKHKAIASAIIGMALATSAHAATTYGTVAFSGYTWSDGATLDGSFTIQYEDGVATTVTYVNVTTGNGPDITGFAYVYDGAGPLTDTIAVHVIWVTQGGNPANEILLQDIAGVTHRALFLDWTGNVDTTELYVGVTGGQYSSETSNHGGSPAPRFLNNLGGSVPEPSTVAMLGLGGLLCLRRRK